MRFPFTFMGAFAVAFGAWILVYTLGGHAGGGTQEAAAVAAGAVMVAFGVYRIALSITRGGQS